MNWDVANPFMQQVIVAAEHTDPFGHANNVAYLKWLEDIAWAHSVAAGLGMSEFQHIGAGFVVRRHELDYLAPTFAGDVLHIGTWVAENHGRADMWRAYQVIRSSDQQAVLRARTRWGCIDMQTGRARRQPSEFTTAYQPVAPNCALQCGVYQ